MSLEDQVDPVKVEPVRETRAQYVLKKHIEIEDLRKKALAAKGVGQSLRNLAPVLAGELRAVVGLLLNTGRLCQQWDTALEAASESAVDDGDKTLAAVAAMLTQFASEAQKRITTHGDMLVDKRAHLLGKADGIEEMLRELHEVVTAPDATSETPPP